MKYLTRFLLMLILLASIGVPLAMPKVVEAATLTVYGDTSGSWTSLHNADAVYNTAWNATSSSDYIASGAHWIGQITAYRIYRSYLYFDTSALPDDATVLSATLSVYGLSDGSATDFDIVIQDGQPTYPHQPMQLSDYDRSQYSGDGGSLNTANFTVGAYNDIEMNGTGTTWISVTGYTKLCLRSSRDIAGTTPSGDEYITTYEARYSGLSRDPKLTITYARVPIVETNAATSVNSSGATLNGNITANGTDNITARGFQWGSSPGSYSNNWTENDPSFDLGEFSYVIGSLSANTTYYFRALAVNGEGTGYGTELSLTTGIPTISVTTSYAANIQPTSATLQGTLQDLGGMDFCSISFEYGLTSSYGSVTSEQTVTSTGIFNASVTGLRYNTTYHFRAVARWGTFVYYGADATFTTLSATGSSTELDIVSAVVISNYQETGDLLFCVEAINTYTGYYPNLRAGKYFNLQLLDTDGATLLAQSELSNWGDRPSSIYVGATQAADLVEGEAYVIRMIGVLIDSEPYTDYTLTTSDWYGYDDDEFYYWCLATATNMQLSDDRTDYLTVLSDVGVVIADEAGGYFNAGIPEIVRLYPSFFATSLASPDFPSGTAENEWDSETAWETNLGATIAADAAIFGNPFGLNGKNFMAGLVILGVVGLVITTTAATKGWGALGVVMLAIPIVWLFTYYRVVPLQIISVIVIFCALVFILTFIVRRL